MTGTGLIVRAVCSIVAVFTIAAGAAFAQPAICAAPRQVRASEPTRLASPSIVRAYQVTLRRCENPAGQARIAIRRMSIDGEKLLLTVDPVTLATALEHEQCWVCAETGAATLHETRYMRAVAASSNEERGPPHSPYLRNAGLVRGEGEGTFVTGDLCPTFHRFDRGFFDRLATLAPRAPVALSITGSWMERHAPDFRWLQERARAGALDITWVNHTYHHPYIAGRPYEGNFLLTPGVDAAAEILETEKLLIANGETPSVFFRFPGLISSQQLMETVRRLHLVTLAAEAWLVFNHNPRPGAVVLVHPNGNEPDGLRLFSRLVEANRLPLPLRPITEAPAGLAPRGAPANACAEPGACARTISDGD